MKVVIKLDGKDVEVESGSAEHVSFLTARADAAEAKAKELTVANSTLQANFDAQKKAAEEAFAKEEEEKAARAKELDDAKKSAKANMKSRFKLVAKALRALYEDDDEDEKEEKADALEDLSDRDIQIKVIQHLEPTFKADGKDDSYVAAYFDALQARPAPAGINSVRAKLRAAPPAVRKDADVKPLWQQPLSVSAATTAK